MTSGDWLTNTLRALAELDREREAPKEVEARLVASFRKNRARKKQRMTVLASLAAAVAIALFVAVPHEHSKPIVPSPVIQQPPVVVAAEQAPVVPKPARKVRPLTKPRREVVTEFFSLQDVAMPFERGELLRVTVPVATMRKVGLPVNEDRLGDRIYADVLVGQEGLARAIRFVSYEQ